MPVTLGKNLHLCFTKIKNPLQPESPSTTHPDPLVINNYNSLFESKSPPRSSSSCEPDFATVFASQRFFFTSPGSSNSIIESTPSIVTPTESSNSLKCNAAADTSLSDNTTANRSDRSESLNSPTVKDSVAVPTYSPDPYLDFRRSMQEMVEARDFIDAKENWDYLHELLLCYLALNPKTAHKFIVRAFADLLVSLLASPSTTQQAEGE